MVWDNFLHVDMIWSFSHEPYQILYHKKSNPTKFCFLIYDNLQVKLSASYIWYDRSDMNLIKYFTTKNTMPHNSACSYMIWSFRHDPYQNVSEFWVLSPEDETNTTHGVPRNMRL